ncbi:unnamed protein product [Diamesa hyperborea]
MMKFVIVLFVIVLMMHMFVNVHSMAIEVEEDDNYPIAFFKVRTPKPNLLPKVCGFKDGKICKMIRNKCRCLFTM